MASSTSSVQYGNPHISNGNFRTVLWTLCGISTLFLTSRFAVRMSTRGRLMVNDYFLIVALPALYIGAGLLQSILDAFYLNVQSVSDADQEINLQSSTAPRVTGAIEMLWLCIYCVKFCFLAQFKFHKPPYAYVSVHLTRYYWASIGICTTAVIFTFIQPILMCPNRAQCRYFQSTSTVMWETSVTVIDIVTDLLVIMIPISLIHMANLTRSHTIINTSFKSLSIFTIAIAATRLVLQYNAQCQRIQYVSLTFWLAIEAAVALIMASISSWRIIVIDHLAERRIKSLQHNTHKFWSGSRRIDRDFIGTLDGRLHDSLSDMPMMSPARLASSSPVT